MGQAPVTIRHLCVGQRHASQLSKLGWRLWWDFYEARSGLLRERHPPAPAPASSSAHC